MDNIQFTPEEREQFIKRLATYNKRSAAIREMSPHHESAIKKLWRRSRQHKLQELDVKRVKLANSYPEPTKHWQSIVLNTIENAAKSKKKKTVIFVINSTHNIGRAAAKRKYREYDPEFQEILSDESKQQLQIVNQQIEELAGFIINKAIQQAERGDAAQMFTCPYQLEKRRRPNNKYLPPNRHQKAYKRIVYKFLGRSNHAQIKRFEKLLPKLVYEAEDIMVVFSKRHMNYSEISASENVIVYELSNMCSYQILSNASGEPTINKLDNIEMCVKTRMSKK